MADQGVQLRQAVGTGNAEVVGKLLGSGDSRMSIEQINFADPKIKQTALICASTKGQ